MLINYAQEKGLRFKNAILIFLVGMFFNILSAYFNQGQSIRDTVLSYNYFYFIMFYFFLHDNKPDRKFLEDVIIVFAIIYSLFYLFQEAAFPRRLFYGNLFYERGTVRAWITGGGFHMLGYFLALNRFFLNRKLINIFLAMFFLLILLKSGFRTMAAASLLLSFILYIKLVKYNPANYFMIILVVILMVGMLQMDQTSSIIENMITSTEEQQKQGEDYIRVMAYDFFTKAFPKNLSYYIVGGGLPGGNSAYGHYFGVLTMQYGFYYSDIGLIGFYFVIGGITTLGLLIYTLRAIFIKLPPDSLYLNIYFAYLLIISFTTHYIYCHGIFAVEALVLYMIDIIKDKMPSKIK